MVEPIKIEMNYSFPVTKYAVIHSSW